MWLISTRFFWPRLYQNHLAMGWQLSSHRVQPDCTFQASCPIIIKSEQVLINGTRQAIEFRHLQYIVAHTNDGTVWFQKIDWQDKGFCEGVCLSKSMERTEKGNIYWCLVPSILRYIHWLTCKCWPLQNSKQLVSFGFCFLFNS